MILTIARLHILVILEVNDSFTDITNYKKAQTKLAWSSQEVLNVCEMFLAIATPDNTFLCHTGSDSFITSHILHH